MPVTILRLDLAISSMNYEFALLIPGYFPCSINSIGFSIKGLCYSLSPRTTDGPSILVRYNMLISFIAHF